MYKLHMYAGAIRKLCYGYTYVRKLKLVDYLPVHSYKTYSNLHMYKIYHHRKQ